MLEDMAMARLEIIGFVFISHYIWRFESKNKMRTSFGSFCYFAITIAKTKSTNWVYRAQGRAESPNWTLMLPTSTETALAGLARTRLDSQILLWSIVRKKVLPKKFMTTSELHNQSSYYFILIEIRGITCQLLLEQIVSNILLLRLSSNMWTNNMSPILV